MGNSERFIFTDHWFAWYPVYTKNKGYVWFKTVKRIMDASYKVYFGLNIEFEYYYKKNN